MAELTAYDVTEAMIIYGGGFVKAFGQLVRQADSENRRRLVEAFPELFDKYRDIARRSPVWVGDVNG